MGLMVFLMGIALGSALGWGRSAGLRASVLNVKSSLALARQLAITHNTRSFFVYGNSTTPVEAGYYVVTTNDENAVIGETNYLPKGYVFVYTTNSVQFLSDGACAAANDTDIVVREIRNQRFLAATVTVTRLTGIARSRE